MTDLWAWQVQEDDGSWGIIAGLFPGGTILPLVTSSRITADMLGLIAVEHHDESGKPIRKARFVLSEVEQEVP